MLKQLTNHDLSAALVPIDNGNVTFYIEAQSGRVKRAACPFNGIFTIPEIESLLGDLRNVQDAIDRGRFDYRFGGAR